ncbi:MAG: hypothetical protein M3Z05_17185 [Gemmatimonadota bacterium]|nr:hypothetical protein [Gemmatimonadota bacterium]
MLLPQTQTVANSPAAVLQIFQDQEVAYSVQLTDAYRGLREAEKQYARTEGAQKEAARSQLTEFESRVAITQQRLNAVHERIGQIQRDAAIATIGGRPSSGIVDAPRNGVFGISPAEFGGGLALLFVFPIVLGLSRWIWRRTSPRAMPGNVLEGNPQFARLEQAVEAIAIEVERISEAQRFSAKLLAGQPVEPVSERAAGPRRAMRPVITPVP